MRSFLGEASPQTAAVLRPYASWSVLPAPATAQRAADGHQRPEVCANSDRGSRTLLDVAREKRDRLLRISASGITTSATSWLRISSAGSASCAPRDRE